MRKDRNPVVDRPLLEKIDQKFRGFRRRRTAGRLRYPSNLRQLALTAVKGGTSAAAVARSAGVSEQSICNWLKENDEEVPQELTIVSKTPLSASSGDGLAGGADATARIHLRSGVLIEVPVGALTPALIGAINGGHAV